MKINREKHYGYYIFLVAILSLGFFLTTLFSYNKGLQMLIVVITAFFYVLWGIIHHCLHHDLNAKIVIEYLLIGGLGVTIALFFLKSLI